MNVPVARRFREQMIASGFNVLNATGLHRIARPLTQGRGAILMFHHVRPWSGEEFAPNRLLEITPQFFDTVLTTVKDSGFDIISLDEAVARLAHQGRRSDRPFVVLTFDDGYRDNRDYALPIMRRHKAPFTLFVTSGFADRSARLWWVELEEAIRAQSRMRARFGDITLERFARTPEEKQKAFDEIYWLLRPGPEQRLLDVVADLCGQAGIDPASLAARLCMDWSELAEIAADPLCTIGAHTMTHPMLAKHDDETVRREIIDGRMFSTTKVDGTDNVYIFRYQGHQSMFVVTKAGVIASDPIGLRRPQAVVAYLAEIKKVTNQPIKYLVYSHPHYDHITGGKPFKDAGAKIVAHKDTIAQLKRFPNADIPLPDEAVGDKRVIKLGDTTLELLYVGANHSDGALVMRLPKEKLIFAVDFAPIQSLPFRNMPDTRNPADWEASLKRLAALEWDRMIPGHPGPGGRLGSKKDVTDLQDYFKDLTVAVKKAADEGKCNDTAMREIKLPKYESWGNYASTLPMNIDRLCYTHNGY